MEKFSLTDIKKRNYSDVYHFIYSHPDCSKQSVASALNMSLPTVTQHLSSLQEEGLIRTNGQLSSAIGRKALAYTVVPEARIALGVEITAHEMKISAVNLYGDVIAQETAAADFETSPGYYQMFDDAIHSFISCHGYEDARILGAGIGIQALVSSDGSTVTYGKILGCTGLSIEHFCARSGFPCRFIHDAECAAMVDLWQHPELKDAVYLSIGKHLGSTVIINGEFHSGVNGKSGIAEHMILVPDGRPCYCGKKGCVESYCSLTALLEDKDSLEHFFEQKRAGNPGYTKRFEVFLNHLSGVLHNLHMVMDIPVILGGPLSSFLEPEDLDYLAESVKSQEILPLCETHIRQGAKMPHMISVGAALPFIREFLTDI